MNELAILNRTVSRRRWLDHAGNDEMQLTQDDVAVLNSQIQVDGSARLQICATDYLDGEQLSRFLGRHQDLAVDLVRMFLLQVARAWAELEVAANEGHMGRLGHRIRILRDSLRMFGACEIPERLQEMEAICRRTSQVPEPDELNEISIMVDCFARELECFAKDQVQRMSERSNHLPPLGKPGVSR